MLLLPIVREQLLLFLNKGGVVAEIGVAKGEFSAQILSSVQPARLHLIDPWEHQDDPEYKPDLSNVNDQEAEDRYRSVSKRFAAETTRGQVVLHRAYSKAAAGLFADACFDWIYVDGIHTHDGLLADLADYHAKVKPDGLILGHDYANHPAADRMNFGVVSAVHQFIREQKWHMLALTIEAWPTYVLARDLQSAAAQLLKMKLIYNIPRIVELRDYPWGAYRQELYAFDKRVASVMTFAAQEACASKTDKKANPLVSQGPEQKI